MGWKKLCCIKCAMRSKFMAMEVVRILVLLALEMMGLANA
jgi:hypothetical protein